MGDDAAGALSEALKVNTTLTILNLICVQQKMEQLERKTKHKNVWQNSKQDP